jgi:hypothetical protein
MSCPIHDPCTCYGAPLQYTATMATTPASTNSSQFAPQTNNIFLGYEWATPLVATTSAAWYPLDLMIQPPTLHSGPDTHLQSGSHRLDNAHEASSLRNMYHQESHGYEREQKLALRSREQVRFPPFLGARTPFRAYAKCSSQRRSTRILRHTSRAFLGWHCPATTPNHWCHSFEPIKVARRLALWILTDTRNSSPS